MGPRAILSVAFAVGLACSQSNAFSCTDDAQCGDGRACELTGYCSVPDAGCPTGRRYISTAAGDLAGACVGGDGGASTGAADAGSSTTATTTTTTTAGMTSSGPGSSSDAGSGTVGGVDPSPLVQYAFDEGSGDRILDSGTATPALDLVVADESTIAWGDGYLEAIAPAVVASEGAADKIIDACTASGEFTVELWARTADIAQTGEVGIVALSAMADSDAAVTVSQNPTTWVFHIRTSDTGGHGLHVDVPGMTDQLTHVVVSRSSGGVLVIHLDGAPVHADVLTGDLSTWPQGSGLAVFDYFPAAGGWLGELHYLAVFDRALGDAEVAARFAAGPG